MADDKKHRPHITLADVPALRRAFDNCKGDTFFFHGHEIYKPYAKYVLEYLEGLIKKEKKHA